MRTTSGRSCCASSAASEPSSAAPAISIASWRPSTSSSPSRKTWLSSTIRTRIGGEGGQIGVLVAGEERQDLPRLGEQTLDDRARDLLELAPAGDRVALDEA